MDQAQERELRRELFTKDWNRAVDQNRPLLDEALDLRKRIAGMLGQPTWAHYAMELKMAGAPERVRAFYEELLPSLGGTVRGELDRLEGLLTADGHDGPIMAWDWRYYDDALRRTEYGVDQDRISEYLPLDPTMEGMFAITGEVFGLEYRVLPEAHAWHESVRLYEILDKATGKSLAHFYADLFPREGKFGHAAAWPLVVGHRAADGEYVAPVSAIVANFTPPSGDRPVAPAPFRGLDALPRVRPHPAHEPHARRVRAIQRLGDRVGLRGGAVPDHGALGVDPIGPRAVRAPSRNR